MNKCLVRNLFCASALIAGLDMMLGGRVLAQTFTTLYNFTGGSDGGGPLSGLVLSGNTLYGTTSYGGSGDYGTVFAVNSDGMGFTNLHSFTGGSGGYHPGGGLVLSSNTLYGTAYFGGRSGNGNGGTNSNGNGTVFAVNINGTGFTNLHIFSAFPQNYFTNSDGANPWAGLILSGNTLYGTALSGGSGGYGTLFAVNTNGTGFTNLHSFNSNSDGEGPYGGLLLSGNILYGTTSAGGVASGRGTVFAINTDGTGFTVLYNFGQETSAGLILSGNTLYGATSGEVGTPSLAVGAVFALNTNGTGFTLLHNFTKSDGANPWAGLILSGNTLYGTAFDGGSGNYGTVFAVNTDGTGFSNLHSFDYVTDGAQPEAGLILSGNTLYGTAYFGGNGKSGTVFSLSLQPQLTITPGGPNLLLMWPTNFTGLTLQSTTNLGSSAIWTTNSSAPVVVNGQNTVTNPISGTQQFFRLSQ